MIRYEFFPKFRGDDSTPMIVDYDGFKWNDLNVVEYLDENDVNVADTVTPEEIDDLSGQFLGQFSDPHSCGGPPKKVRG